jgi:hypothetical protein
MGSGRIRLLAANRNKKNYLPLILVDVCFNRFKNFSLSSPSQTNPKIAINYESIIYQRQSAKEWQHCKTSKTGYGRRG